MSVRLTPAQLRVLVHAARHTFGRAVCGDPRTREKLLAQKLIELDGYSVNGSLFKITDAGRDLVKACV